MRHSLPIAPQFYVTAPQACPYLADRTERKLFTALRSEHATMLNDSLSHQGFRRSQNVVYRPACKNCSACLSVRIRVADFLPSRGQRRVSRRNARLCRRASSPWATDAQYALFRNYLDARHANGGMADMDVFEFSAMVEETPVRSRVLEYYDEGANHRRDDDDLDDGEPYNETQSQADGKEVDDADADSAGFRPKVDVDPALKAVCLTDVISDGLSMVYSFFDPALSHRSPGTYLILDHIALAQEVGLPYVYLGYWVPGSDKMDYKAGFSALEIYHQGRWQALDNPRALSGVDLSGSSLDISEQVAAITLPDGVAGPYC